MINNISFLYVLVENILIEAQHITVDHKNRKFKGL